MEVTEEERNLVLEARRKTEIDRTHNTALATAWAVCTDVIDASCNPTLAADIMQKINAKIEPLYREVKL